MDLFGRQRRRIAELKAWAAGRAIHLESLAAADPARLAGLGGLLEGKRIVYLGEADHFVSEVFAFRLLLLRFLIPRGSKDWPSARLLDSRAGPPTASLGTELARSHPGEVFSIWLLHAFGEDSQPLAWLPQRLTLARRSVNAALAELGPCFLLPLGETSGLPELLRGEQELRWIYNAGCRTELARQADALFFVRAATPVSPPR
jgi:hypothetical protein